jgi:histidinol phosphatase-like enzyme (inositol monophosphatase family)
MTAPQELAARLALGLAAAQEAGEITLGFFRSADLGVESKEDLSPVTLADREAEQYLRMRISEAFPRDAILGEEFGQRPGDSGYRWILDPIDGTKSFVHGVPLYGTLIGLQWQERNVLGIINVPVLQERVYALVGQGAWYQQGRGEPQPARVRACPKLADATLLTSEIEGFTAVGRFDVLQRLQAAARLTRTWGDCYGYLLVATGRADVMIDPRMHIWDAAALLPILQEAGGVFTDWEGTASIESGNGLATSAALLPDVLALIHGG